MDRQVWANRVDTYSLMIGIHLVCHSFCIIWIDYCPVKPHCSILCVIKTKAIVSNRSNISLQLAMQPFPPFCWFKKDSCQLLAKEWALSTSNCLGGLPRNSVARLTDHFWNDLKCVEGPLNTNSASQQLVMRFGESEFSDYIVHTCMYQPMILESKHLCERFPTSLAAVRFLSSMSQHMCLEVMLTFEWFAARGTQVWLLSGMNKDMFP